jgi:PAS domain S-box-containing protein
VRYGTALAAVLVTTGLIALVNSDWAIFDPITIENPGTIYIATVTLVALLIGAGPALVTAVASLLAVFLVYAKNESIERSVVLIGTMLIIIGLAAWQRRAQDAAERAQAKFEAILESMSDAVMVVDAAGRSTDVNHAAIAMLGAADRADALAKLTHRRTDGTPATDEYALLERALAGEKSPQHDVLIPDAPGGPRIASAVAGPMRDAHGRLTGAVSVSRDMTDRLAQAQERESLLRRIGQEQQFTAQVLANVPVGIAVVRADDFTVLSFNGEYDTSIRHAPGGHPLTIGRSLLDAMPAASHDAATALLARARDEQTTIRSAAYAATVVPDQYYDGTIQPLHLGDGTAALLITAINVTKRLRDEQEREELLRQVERQAAQLAATFEAMVDGIAVYDVGGDVLHRNESFYRLLSLEPGSAPPVWEAFIHDMHLRRADGTPMTRADTHSFRALNGETIHDEVVLVRDGRGRDRYMSQNAAPIRAAGGAVIGAVVVFNDVTERLEQERERERLLALLEERRQFTQAIFDIVPVCLAVVDTDAMVFSAANPAFIEATPESYRDLGVSGHSLTTVLPHTIENGFVSQLRHTGRTGERFEASATRYEHPTRGVTHWNETMIPLTTSDPAAHHVLYIAADVTKEIEARQRIVALAREAAQRAAEQEAIIANMPDGVAIYRADGQLAQMNPAGRAITGEDISPGDARPAVVDHFDMRYSDGRVIPLDDLPLSRALRGETVSGYEFISHTRHGDRTILMSSAPIHDAAGEIASAVVVFSDISERRAAEQQREQLLREIDARRRFVQTVVESTPVGIAAFGVDTDLTVRMANDQYLQLLDPSWRETGITGHGVREFVPDADASGLITLAQQVIERGESIMLREFEFNGFARGAGYFDASIVPLRESGAHVTGVLTVVADVTERVESRHRIEELAWDAAQRASELETVIASIADGVMVTDAEGRIILENAAAGRLTGRTQSAISLGLEAQVAVHALRASDGTPIPPAELPLGRAVRGETVVEQVLIVRRVDTGEDRFLMCSSAPVRAGHGAITGAVAVFRDITEMKQIDQMKDDFVSIAAHELRTPLTAIKGYAELLERRLSMQQGRESDQRSLGVIRKQTERLASLINEMLDVSRIEGGRLQLNAEPFDLSALIGEVVNNMRVSSEAHLLSLAAVPGIEVNGDAARIEQVLLNLITNAITYSPEGGEVAVRVWAEKGAALVSVRDRGVGIASDELPQLFDRFYRAPRAGVMRSGGMGLGLYICQEIVARHGGTIRAESVEGAGSTFTFSLPLIQKGRGLRTED